MWNAAKERAYARGRQAGFGYNFTAGPEHNPYVRADLRQLWEQGRQDEIAKLAAADTQSNGPTDALQEKE